MRGVWSGSAVWSWEMPYGTSDRGVRWGTVTTSGLHGQDGACFSQEALLQTQVTDSQDPTTMHKNMLSGPNESI